MYLNGLILNRPEVMIGTAPSKFDADGKLTDAATAGHISKMLVALVAWTQKVGLKTPAG